MTVALSGIGSGALAQSGVSHDRHQAAAAGDHAAHEAMASTVFPTREASGTAWVPDLTPMHGVHRRLLGWETMVHGRAFIQSLHEFAPAHRGGHQAGSMSWIMGMARRPLGGGRVGLRLMLSLEPWTIPGCGYPSLLATGELCEGDNIHDLQHPHDLFMEVAAEYERPFAGSLSWQIYAGPAGEPALGPAAFPHRASAMSNPLAPMTHHWLDSTHITYGVVTTGLHARRWKAEASVFNGREPDENRTDLDVGALDSFSGRISFLPTETLALQVSAGHLEDAEMAHLRAPRLDVERVTASATYFRRLRDRTVVATTVAWGANQEAGTRTHAGLAEASVTFVDRHTVFGRIELNEKPAHDLHIHESAGVFTVGKTQAGYIRYLAPRSGLQAGFGATVSAAFVPADLRPRYGGVGLGLGVFATVRPAAR